MSEDETHNDETSRFEDSVRRLVDHITAKSPPKSAFERWANTPFVVTVIGGLIGTVVTFTWKDLDEKAQTQAAEVRRTAEAHQRQFQRQYDLMYSVMNKAADEIPDALSRFMDYQYAWAWLDENAKDKPPNPKSGKTYYEVWVDFDTRVKPQWAKTPTINSFSPQIRATFRSEKVHHLAEEFQCSVDKAFEAKTESDITKRLEAINHVYDALIPAMGEELSAYAQKLDNQ